MRTYGSLASNMYSIGSGKRLLLPETYISTNLLYSFTPRVTGVEISNNYSKITK